MAGMTGAPPLRTRAPRPVRGRMLAERQRAEHRRGMALLAILGLMIVASWAVAVGLAWLVIAALS